MAHDEGITAGINQITITWASPIRIDQEKNQERRIVRLLESSDESWVSDSLDIQPDFRNQGQLGFAVAEERGQQLLAVMVEGPLRLFL